MAGGPPTFEDLLPERGASSTSKDGAPPSFDDLDGPDDYSEGAQATSKHLGQVLKVGEKKLVGNLQPLANCTELAGKVSECDIMILPDRQVCLLAASNATRV